MDHDQRTYWFHLAIRVYIYGRNSNTRTRKNELKFFWEDEEFIAKFQTFSLEKKLAYRYKRWSVIFCTHIALVDDWQGLSVAWSTCVSLPESLAADEKNYKTRCKHNPFV